jgi:hypothetical protein
MNLQRLSCLVLAVVLGTAVAVRWYLDAEAAVLAGRPDGSRAVVYQHVPLLMRAEPARFRLVRPGSRHALQGPCDAAEPISAPGLVPLVRHRVGAGDVPASAGPSALEPGTGAPF